MNNLDFNKYKKIIVITLLGIMFGVLIIILNYLKVIELFIKVFKSIIPVFVAVIISFLFEPLILFFENKKIKHNLSVIIVYSLVTIIFILIVVLFVPPFLRQIQQFLLNLPSLIDEINMMFGDVFKALGIIDLNVTLRNLISEYSKSLFDDMGNALSNVLYFFMAYVGSLFLSFDFGAFKRLIKAIFPTNVQNHVSSFFNEYSPFIYKYLKGVLYDTFILWSLSTFAFYLCGLEYAIIYGLILSVFNLIPIIGSYIGGIPAILVGLTISPLRGLYILIAVVAVQLVESNFINPCIMRNVIKIHPLEGLFSLLLLGGLFGFIGMIISPLVWIAVKIIYRQITHSKNSALNID